MRILVVDDDLMVANSLGRFLDHQMGHEVTICCSAGEAIDTFEKDPFPLVITDIRMPDMGGIDLTRALRHSQFSAGTHIVVITGFPNDDTLQQAIQAGACEYLRKPIDINQLESIINRLEAHGCTASHLSSADWSDRLKNHCSC